MTSIEAFHRLGIPMTKDLSEIKQAYQGLLPRNHPEKNPDGFMRLHDAYKTAMAYAKGTGGLSSNTFSWEPEKRPSAPAETAYDSLFAALEENRTMDLSQAKKELDRKLRRLKLHWLPIPLKTWQEFFAGESYLLCRGEEPYLDELLGLLERKIHSYAVFCFLTEKLWELEGWQREEKLEAHAVKTRSSIKTLENQYRHYLKRNTGNPVGGLLYPAFWYYQAIPFYFKLVVSVILFPVTSLGSEDAIMGLLLTFYFLEFCTWIRKSVRGLGMFHSQLRIKNGKLHYEKSADSTWVYVVTIYAIFIHIATCAVIVEGFSG